jgi:hypothetical protein
MVIVALLVRAADASSAGQDGPPLYPGPLCGGESGSTGRIAGIDMEVDAFSPGQESGRKARPRLTDLPGFIRQAPSGVSFSLGYFSFGQAKEKYLGRRRHTKALSFNSTKEKAHQSAGFFTSTHR